MRRKEKEIHNFADIEAIFEKSKVCRLAFNDQDYPYIIPMNFGYKNRELFFHSAQQGKKVDLIKTNKHASFQIDIDHVVIESQQACHWTANFSSVIGSGIIKTIVDTEGKIDALKTIMSHYSGTSNWSFDKDVIKKVLTFKLIIKEVSAKKSGL